MSAEPISGIHLPLSRALLCAEPDCNMIFALPRTECPACGSSASLPLSRVLGDGRNELTEDLKALSRLVTWPKRPPRRRSTDVDRH